MLLKAIEIDPNYARAHDGVNVAARLQELAEPGGICISGKVYEEVEGNHDERFEDAGAHEVKNIESKRWPSLRRNVPHANRTRNASP